MYGGASGIDEQCTASTGSRSAVELDVLVLRIGGSSATIFTNLPRRTFTALTSTNLALPLAQWTELPTLVENPAGQYRITHADTNAPPQRFYGIKSP